MVTILHDFLWHLRLRMIPNAHFLKHLRIRLGLMQVDFSLTHFPSLSFFLQTTEVERQIDTTVHLLRTIRPRLLVQQTDVDPSGLVPLNTHLYSNGPHLLANDPFRFRKMRHL